MMHDLSGTARSPSVSTFFALWVALAAIYVSSPNTQVCDSHYTLLTAETLLRHRDVALERYVRYPLVPDRWPGTFRSDLAPQQIVYVGDRLYYGYPIGSSLLSLPFVAAAIAAGESTISVDGEYDVKSEVRLQRIVAAGLISLAVATLFLLASQVLSPVASLVAALFLGLGTPYWSTLALALWGQDWLVLLLGLLLVHLAAAERSARAPRAWWVALLGAMMLSVRFTSAISLAACAVYLAEKNRRCLVRVLLWGALFVSLLLIFNRWAYGSFLQPVHYVRSLWTADGIPERALGLLVSPSRGLLVFVPLAALAVLLCLVYFDSVPQRALVRAGLFAVGLHFAMLCFYSDWWGGYGYGPRLFADVLPWFFLLGVAGWAGARRALAPFLQRSLVAGTLVLGLWSAFVHWRGATDIETLLWSSNYQLEHHPEMLWSYPGQIWPTSRQSEGQLYADGFETGTTAAWDLVEP